MHQTHTCYWCSGPSCNFLLPFSQTHCSPQLWRGWWPAQEDIKHMYKNITYIVTEQNTTGEPWWGFSSPQEEAHPGQRGHAPWISLPTGKWRWPRPLHRDCSGTSRPGPTVGHLPGICSPPVSDWHSRRSEAIWTAPAHGSQPVRGVVIRTVGLFALGQVLILHRLF